MSNQLCVGEERETINGKKILLVEAKGGIF